MSNVYKIVFAFVVVCLCITATHAQPLNGNYTIDDGTPTGGTNFASFTEFSASLTANGVSGHVIATAVAGSGPYTEQVTFQNIGGLGPTASLTIDGSDVTMTSDTAIDQQGGDNPNRHIIRLVSLNSVTIKNLNIEMKVNSTGFIAIQALTSGTDITISNCDVNMGAGTSTLLGAFVFNGDPTSIITQGGTFDNIQILRNTVTGGGYGVSVFGLPSPSLATGVLIDDNVFKRFHSNGVYLRETDGAVVSNNTFDKDSALGGSNAIQLAQANNINGNVFNNRIMATQPINANGTYRGIYLFNGTGHKAYNNVMTDIHLTSGNVVGIEVRTGNTASEISFNTINFDSPAPTTGILHGIREELSNTGVILRNNVVNITQPSDTFKAAIVVATNTTAFNSNYNVLWVPGGNIGQKGTIINVSFFPSFTDWQAAFSQDANSLNVDPQFQSPSLPRPTNPDLDDAGTPIAGINEDITGATRGAVPDPGAYELCLELPTAAFTFAQNGAAFTFTNTSTNATNFAWTFGSASDTSSAENPTFTFANEGSYTVTLIASGPCGADTVEQSVTFVSLGDLTVSLNATVYPNPTTGTALLSFTNPTHQGIEIAIVDMTGRVRVIDKRTAAAGQYNATIDTGSLSPGVYSVRVATENGVARLPLTVLR